MVEYSADFYILKPVDLAKGNGAMLLRRQQPRQQGDRSRRSTTRAGSNDPTTAEHAGNGFLMRQRLHGGVERLDAGPAGEQQPLRIEVPTATGAPARSSRRCGTSSSSTTARPCGAASPIAATSTDKSQAKLVVRDRNSDEPSVVPADQWEFVDARTIRLLPAGTPFRIGAIYQLIYKAANPPVNGIGFAATRDLISFLRYATADDAGTPNPLAVGERDHARARRTATRRPAAICATSSTRASTRTNSTGSCFDGALPNVAAARIYLNYRFGQPNRIIPAGHGFMLSPGRDLPVTPTRRRPIPSPAQRDGSSRAALRAATCPKIIHTISSTEYWQSAQSLVTTDPLGQRDGTPPDNVRIYHFAGTQHPGVRAARCRKASARCRLEPQLDYRPLLRAALVNLDRWVKDGMAAPASRYPRIADGTLVESSSLAADPGLHAGEEPDSARRASTTGPTSTRASSARRCRSSSRTPITCWSRRSTPTATRLRACGCPRSWCRPAPPPAGTCAHRKRAPPASCAISKARSCRSPRPRPSARPSKDPRPSLEERYKDRNDYAERIKAATAELQREGYLLEEDATRINARAASVAW